MLVTGQVVVRCQLVPLTPPIQWRSNPPEASVDAVMCWLCLGAPVEDALTAGYQVDHAGTLQEGWSARQTRSRDPMFSTPRGEASEHALPDAAREAIQAVLEPSETVEFVARAVGSSLVLTQRRLIVVRDGASFRPKSGVRSFELNAAFSIRVGPARRGVIIQSDAGTINVFVRSEQLAQAEAFVAEVRRRIYQEG